MEILSKKNVLIVGATGGIGSEACKLICNNQANVFITSRDQQKLDSLGDLCKIPTSQRFLLDITQPKEIEQLVDNIYALVERVDILINASGVGIIKPIESLSIEDFDRSIDINLKGNFYLLKHFLPKMKAEKKGLIINIPGVLGKAPMAGAAAYSASKYGLNGMLKSVREELKRTNVRITNLYLGGVDSPFWDEIDMRVNRDKFITAKEAGRAIWFLCQQPSSGVVSEMVIQPFNHQVL